MSEILEGVLKEFEKLAAIPRPSKHEEKVCHFLREYLESLGFTVAQDSFKNLVADIPASAGKENAPLTILQAHVDMVCVADEGVHYNPLEDSIKLIRDENFLKADGTSLGADNGVGVATILYIAKNAAKLQHGPLRIILTTDEEQGMSGAINIDAKHFLDAQFLLNLDSENYDEIVVSSAGHVYFDLSRRINHVAPKFSSAFQVKLSGLTGGHSGIEIVKDRANSIKAAENLLRLIAQYGDFQLANLNGGKASNVIPSEADFVIVTNLSAEKISNCGVALRERIEKIYGENLFVELKAVDLPDKVLSAEDFASLTALISTVHSGVYAINQNVPNSPVTSTNLGIVRVAEKIDATIMSRSNVTERLEDFINSFAQLSKITGFEVAISQETPAWNFNPKSRLVEIMSKVFLAQNNFPVQVHTSHAGLETSYFLVKNPKLDVVSIGTTNFDIHSPQERLELKTVEPHVRLILETLKQISD